MDIVDVFEKRGKRNLEGGGGGKNRGGMENLEGVD